MSRKGSRKTGPGSLACTVMWILPTIIFSTPLKENEEEKHAVQNGLETKSGRQKVKGAAIAPPKYTNGRTAIEEEDEENDVEDQDQDPEDNTVVLVQVILEAMPVVVVIRCW